MNQLCFRIVSRRRGTQGRDLPETVSASAPLVVSFLGEARSSAAADGTVEAVRDVVVTLPPSDESGLKRGEVVFAWPEGLKEAMPVGWEVRPSLRLIPAGLVLRGVDRPIKRTVVVQSDTAPFRLIQVASTLLGIPVALPDEPAVRHTIDLELDPSEVAPERTYNVKITTDHADQSSIDLSVLILPDGDGKGE